MNNMASDARRTKAFTWNALGCCQNGPCEACLIRLFDDEYSVQNHTGTILNHVKAMHEWVKQNCDIPTQTVFLERILMAASFRHIPDIVKYAIGADKAIVDFLPDMHFVSRLDASFQMSHTTFVNHLMGEGEFGYPNVMTAAMYAIKHNDFELLKWLTEEAGAALDIRTSNQNALSCAIENNNKTILKFLLEKGADPNKMATSEGGALHFAIEKRSKEMVQILLDCPITDVNLLDAISASKHAFSGNHIHSTPLMCALNEEDVPSVNLDLVEMLLKHGADVNKVSGNCTDLAPETPLICATSLQNLPCIKLLLSYGADPNVKIPGDISGSFIVRAAGSNDIEIFKLAMTLTSDASAEQREQVIVNAARMGNTAVLKLGLTIPAKTEANKLHATKALLEAIAAPFDTMAELLKVGADPNEIPESELEYGNLFHLFENWEDNDKRLALLIEHGAIPRLFLDDLEKHYIEWSEDLKFSSNDSFHEFNATIKNPAPYENFAKFMSQGDIPRFLELVEKYVSGLENEKAILDVCHDLPDVCSLQHQCRDKIRELIIRPPCDFKQRLGELGLPKPLENYLMFK